MWADSPTSMISRPVLRRSCNGSRFGVHACSEGVSSGYRSPQQSESRLRFDATGNGTLRKDHASAVRFSGVSGIRVSLKFTEILVEAGSHRDELLNYYPFRSCDAVMMESRTLSNSPSLKAGACEDGSPRETVDTDQRHLLPKGTELDLPKNAAPS
jgi:hypothetical protein